MYFAWKRAALAAVLVYLLLFLLRFNFPGPSEGNFQPIAGGEMNQVSNDFENSRKNYASSKTQLPTGQPTIGDPQKYEKVGSLTQRTQEYDADRKRIDELIETNGGIVQLERATGLKAWRVLHLGIGVPPGKFDTFIEAARGIGKSISIEIVKNDKTNEYLQLKAKRSTLEKARTALEELKAGGGSTGERVEVQNRLTEIEQQIQDLGVSLGEFDSQNELCTVKLTLREAYKAVPVSVARRAFRAFETSLLDYMMLGLGFFGLMAAAWIGARVASQVRKLVANPSAI